MYCSSCGMAITQGLSYCNYCGAKLNAAKGEGVSKSSELFPDSLVWAIVTVFIVGLGCIIGLMAVMKEALDFNVGMILAITLLSFALMFSVEGVLIRLLLSRMRSAKKVGDIERLKEQATKELEEAQPRALPEPLPSVTEHTTRTLDPIYSERKSKSSSAT